MGLSAIRFLMLWWACVPSRLFVFVCIVSVARSAVRVITFSVAWGAVVVAERGTVRALGVFLRGDYLRVCVIVEVERLKLRVASLTL
jgi:hypothetical protein